MSKYIHGIMIRLWSNYMKLSITGADNLVNIQDLKRIVNKYPHLELAILLLKEKEGTLRNPSAQWRRDFTAHINKKNSAIHLCGKQVFDEILSKNFENTDLFQELKAVGKIQININAKQDIFTVEQIHEIYHRLIGNDLKIILQYHSRSEDYIVDFLEKNYSSKVDILLDSSLGKGIVTTSFVVPERLQKFNLNIGFAGGISPDNISDIHEKIKNNFQKNYWLDLESGCRTHNEFDLMKMYQLCDNFFGAK